MKPQPLGPRYRKLFSAVVSSNLGDGVGLVAYAWLASAVTRNTITVSLRQRIIPSNLLGRVNSVYRFFAWGMMPISPVVGGLIVLVTTQIADRETGLRATWWIAGGIQLLLLVGAHRSLTTARIHAAEPCAER